MGNTNETKAKRGKNPKYYVDNESRALAGRASIPFHERVEEVSKLMGIDKATFVRLATRFLLQHLSDGKGGITIDDEVTQEIPFCRSAMDVHKGIV